MRNFKKIEIQGTARLTRTARFKTVNVDKFRKISSPRLQGLFFHSCFRKRHSYQVNFRRYGLILPRIQLLGLCLLKRKDNIGMWISPAQQRLPLPNKNHTSKLMAMCMFLESLWRDLLTKHNSEKAFILFLQQ